MKKKDYIGCLVEVKSVNKNNGVLQTEVYRIKKIKDNNLISDNGIIICHINDIGTIQYYDEYETTITLL